METQEEMLRSTAQFEEFAGKTNIRSVNHKSSPYEKSNNKEATTQ